MKMQKIYSWGNNFYKDVELNSDLSENYGIYLGNQNSYGDCFIPYSHFSYKSKRKEKLFCEPDLDPSVTIEEYIYGNKKLLFGIPGKANVTIGGAVAADTHGKDNIWGGSFSKNIHSLKLKLANGQIIECSDKKNREVFTATLGGYGLTGVIEKVTIKENKIPLPPSFLKQKQKGSGLENLFNEFDESPYTYWVAWVNLLNKRFDWVVEKSFSGKQDIKSKKSSDSYIKKLNLPFIGSNSLNSMSYINNIYFNLNSTTKAKSSSINKTLYPLSMISDTRNISPKRKILQIQFSLPLKNEKYIQELIERLIYKQVPLLCSIKRLGSPLYTESLSFYQDGWTVAVDFSEKYFDLSYFEEFMKKLLDYEGKIYLAKDSLLNEKYFKAMYPNFKNWEQVVKKLDPNSKFQSHMSNRLGLKQW